MKYTLRSLLCTILLFTSIATYSYAEQLTVTMLNVADAECILIQVDDEFMVVDTAYAKSWDYIQAELVSRGITKIDYLVLTHPHQDHIGSGISLIETYPIDQAILPPIEYDTSLYERVLTPLDDHAVDVWYPFVGDSFLLGQARIIVYAPHNTAYPSPNDWSIAFMLRYASRTVQYIPKIGFYPAHPHVG